MFIIIVVLSLIQNIYMLKRSIFSLFLNPVLSQQYIFENSIIANKHQSSLKFIKKHRLLILASIIIDQF